MIATYKDIEKQIGESVNIFNGRMMENLKRSVGDKLLASFDLSLGLPVSLRRRWAFRSRIMGADVSDIRIMDMIVKAPAWKS